MISRKWRANWANLSPFFAYPPEIHRLGRRFTTTTQSMLCTPRRTKSMRASWLLTRPVRPSCSQT